MKGQQAVLILAHKNFPQLLALIQKLTPTFRVYIHFDKKMVLRPHEKKELAQFENVSFFSKYDVKWGSFSIVSATLDLIKIALADPTVGYLHLISGQDWPAQAPAAVAAFYDAHPAIYLDYWLAQTREKSHEQQIWWTKFYYNYDQVNRRSTFGKLYHRVLIAVQLLLRVNKLKRLGVSSQEIYAGQQWFDAPREALAYAVQKFESDPRWRQLFTTSFCPDEFWLQTMLCNSEYQSAIVNDLHRYILWEHREGNYPAILDDRDLTAIKQSKALWMRKIELPISASLLKKL